MLNGKKYREVVAYLGNVFYFVTIEITFTLWQPNISKIARDNFELF